MFGTSSESVLTWRIIDPPDYIAPPGASRPSFDDSNLATFSRPDGREGVHVHIPMSQVADADYMIFAQTILLGYDVPQPDVRHFRINVQNWYVYDDLEGPTQAEYSPWVNCRDVNLFVRISNGVPDEGDPLEFACDSDENYMPYCNPDEDSSNFADTIFDVFIRPDDALVLSFRAKEGEQPLAENDEGGFAEQAFTSAESWGIGTHHLRQNDHAFAGEYEDDYGCDGPDGTCYEITYSIEQIWDPTAVTVGVPAVQYAQNPNHFTATLFTPDSPDKPRRQQTIVFNFIGSGGNAQGFQGFTGDDGIAAPIDLITLPGGQYQLSCAFLGSTLLLESVTSEDPVTVEKDFTSSSLTMEHEIRWGHRDPMTVTLIEPNVGQPEPPLPIPGKMMSINFTGPNGAKSFPAGPTDAFGVVTITPLMDLPPGNYEVTACFAEDDWFLGSCSTPKAVKVTAGFAAFATGGPVIINGTHQTSLGDLHSEGALGLSGNTHVLSAGAGERLEYVTTFTDGSTGSVYNLFQVPALGIAPQYLASTYCAVGMTDVMGVPITRINGNWKIPNNSVISGIYCVTGDIKIQPGGTGSAVLVAGRTMTASGGAQNLTTADPTGADVLVLAGSTAVKAISIGANDAFIRGALVAQGGIEVSGMNTLVDPALIGLTVTVKGSNNVVDGRVSD